MQHSRKVSLVAIANLSILTALSGCDPGVEPAGPPSEFDAAFSHSSGASPFFGTWTGTDRDGSTLTLGISPLSPTRARLHLFDDGATGCGPDASGNLIPAVFAGKGTISGNVLDFQGDARCLDQPPRFLGTFVASLIYDPETDTLPEAFCVAEPAETPCFLSRKVGA